jgi:hypothetical protein
MNTLSMPCPHCEKRANVRSSQPMSRTLRELHFQCLDLECGHTWIAMLEAVRTVSPSGKPDPEIAAQLPFTPRLPAAYPRPRI